jgi:hypothetical protein
MWPSPFPAGMRMQCPAAQNIVAGERDQHEAGISAVAELGWSTRSPQAISGTDGPH